LLLPFAELNTITSINICFVWFEKYAKHWLIKLINGFDIHVLHLGMKDFMGTLKALDVTGSIILCICLDYEINVISSIIWCNCLDYSIVVSRWATMVSQVCW